MGVAAVLLILPGFFTDTLGLFLLLPPVRALMIRQMGRRMQGVTIIRRGAAYEEEVYEHRTGDDRLN
jgi:UPF0716 protein FxsA